MIQNSMHITKQQLKIGELEMVILFEGITLPVEERFISISVPEDKINRIKEIIPKIIEKKMEEPHHRVDSGNEYKRFYTGFLGEAAIEQLFDVEFIDWSVGKSSFYHVADLKSLGLDVGIKSVEYGKFPIINKHIKRPEIIIIKNSDTNVSLCGLASMSVLSRYQNSDLILSDSLRSRGTKTAFYGFKFLIGFNNIEELKEIVNYNH